jgi:O-antigen ligase
MNETVRVSAVLVAAVLSLVWAEFRGGARNARVLRVVSCAWMWLVFSEAFLLRTRPADDALAGDFALSAQGEALSWAIAAVFVALLAVRWPTAFSGLFKPPLLWAASFAMLAAISTMWSYSPTYSAVWAGKLIVVVAVLGGLTTILTLAPENILGFMKLLWATFFIASLMPSVLVLVDPAAAAAAAEESYGRSQSLSTSEPAAVAMLLALVLADVTRRRYFYAAMALSFVLMFSGLGKTAIIGGVFSVLLYTALTRGRSAVPVWIGYAVVATTLTALAVGAMPELGAYLFEYYDQGHATNISGRVPLWEASFGLIREQWVVGHGYLSSRFLFTRVTPWGAVMPTSLHNVALEVLYNNGVVGLAVLVVLNASCVHCLWRGWRQRQTRDPLYGFWYAAGLTLYAGSLINGMAGVYFGGPPHKGFVLFLTTIAVLQVLAYLPRTPWQRQQSRSGVSGTPLRGVLYRMPHTGTTPAAPTTEPRLVRG